MKEGEELSPTTAQNLNAMCGCVAFLSLFFIPT